MDPLDFLTEDDLMKFFHCKKTEISCIKEPNTFLNQLRDFDLVPEDQYKKVIKMKSLERRQKGVYDILDWLEKKGGQSVKQFWSCVFKDHILHKYPSLVLLRNSLLDGTYNFYEKLPGTEEANNNKSEEKKVKGMKGGRKRKKGFEDTEEEEEPGPSSHSTPTQKKPNKNPTFSTSIRKGENLPIWKFPLFKSSFPVTCGDKKGTLHRTKLAKGIKCILSDGKWFTPNGFEKFAGKENWKNWKLSIRCQNTPLRTLIKKGDLKCPRMRKQPVRKSQRVLFPVSSSESSSPRSEPSVESEGTTEEQEEDREEDEEHEDEENVEEEEESEAVDMSAFEADVLPVSCGSFTGDLYKKRFIGPNRKSIRTEERWFTPEEFAQQESTLTDGHWKKDILCHGKTLYYVLKNKMLAIHSLLCVCGQCHTDDPQDDNNDDVCFVCDSVQDDDDKELVCCDDCPRAFHQNCHLPIPEKNSDRWMCTFCVWKINQRVWLNLSLEDALNSPVTQDNMMRCQYLLLCLYKEDTQHVFTYDPYTTTPGNSSEISTTMWLNRVKNKLQRSNYRTVREFIKDIRRIFQNCHTNSDNNFAVMGARLSEMFEEKFRIVFKIQ